MARAKAMGVAAAGCRGESGWGACGHRSSLPLRDAISNLDGGDPPSFSPKLPYWR